MSNERSGKHSRGLLCDRCKGNLKAMFHYTSDGQLVRGGDMFYCDACDFAYKIHKEVIGVVSEPAKDLKSK